MSDHYSADFVQDHNGWWQGRCNCGLDLGMFPDPEDVCDALMDHAYEAGGAESRTLARVHDIATRGVGPDTSPLEALATIAAYIEKRRSS